MLRILDRREWLCEASAGFGVIQISRAIVEYLWCQAYAYIIIYQKIASVPHGTVIDLHAEAETSRAAHLLQWTFESWLKQEEGVWPEGLPRPVADAVKESPENVADELCLSALAFFLHHEIAHCHQDSTGREQRELEIEADKEAVGLLLDGLLPSDPSSSSERSPSCSASRAPSGMAFTPVTKERATTHPTIVA